MDDPGDLFAPEEIARRRDEVVRRMANTPPQPRVSPVPEKAKATDVGRAPRKRADHRAKPDTVIC